MISDHNAKLLVRAMAVQVQVEGMKSQNAYAAVSNREPYYNQHDFDGYATELQQISEEMKS